jgi:hypothetical protein
MVLRDKTPNTITQITNEKEFINCLLQDEIIDRVKVQNELQQTQKFLNNVMNNYGNRVGSTKAKIEDSFEYGKTNKKDDTALIEVFDRANELEPIGTMQIVDGSRRVFGQSFAPGNSGSSGRSLPFKLVGYARDVIGQTSFELQISAAIQNNFKVFEVGKFSLTGEGEKRTRSRNLIELIWLTEYAEIYPNALFLAHINSKVHEDHYAESYGYRVLETFSNGDGKGVEKLIGVEGWRLAQHLRKRLNLPDLDLSKFKISTNLDDDLYHIFLHGTNLSNDSQ